MTQDAEICHRAVPAEGKEMRSRRMSECGGEGAIATQSPVEHRLELRRKDGSVAELIYRPHSSELFWAESGAPVDLSPVGFKYEPMGTRQWVPAEAISPTRPGTKGRAIRTLKIQMGLKCNYACPYCNQTSRPESSHGSPDDAREFLAQLPSWFKAVNDDGDGLTIEFWGGEPFVYWKTMRLLGEELRTRYPNAFFNVVTNGSVLDDEKIDWLDRMKFSVAISHDGPGQKSNRGKDPFDDPANAEAIRKLYRRLYPKGLINFNCVLARNNLSLSAIRRYLADKMGCPEGDIRLSTEEMLLPYEALGMEFSLHGPDERQALFQRLYLDIVRGGAVQVLNVREKLHDFFGSLASARPASALGQRCAMDRNDTVAVDLKGNVLTCQNTPGDVGNRIGHVSNYEGVRLDKAYHWSARDECNDCLVLQMCRGSCMRLTGGLWAKACENSYAYNLAILTVGIEYLTGCRWDAGRYLASYRTPENCSQTSGVAVRIQCEGPRRGRSL